MRYRVYDVEAKKERTLTDCVTRLGEVGTERKVNIKVGGVMEPHTFRVLEILPDEK